MDDFKRSQTIDKFVGPEFVMCKGDKTFDCAPVVKELNLFRGKKWFSEMEWNRFVTKLADIHCVLLIRKSSGLK